MENRVIHISDISDERVAVYSDMNENRIKRMLEPEPGYFIAETTLVTQRAIAAGYEPVSFLVDGTMLDDEGMEILEGYPNVPIYTSGKDNLYGITGYELTRGFLCQMRRKYTLSHGAKGDVRFLHPNEVFKNMNRVVILDRVMNPVNLGSIIRSAAALDFDGILFLKGCADPLYRRALRVSMGNIFMIPWTMVMDDEDNISIIGEMKESGFKFAAMALSEESISIKDPILKQNDKLAVVMGSERDGISNEILRECDYVVKIPMREGVDSLNVAAATAIALWEFGKERIND